jgi:hypothetical protein
MINLFFTSEIYSIFKLNIDYLIENFKFLKKNIILNEEHLYEYIITNKLLYSNNIYINEISEDLLKRLSGINYFDNCFLLNIKELKDNEDISYLNNYNITILDFNPLNVHLSTKYKQFIRLYSTNTYSSINNIDKINDVAILNIDSEDKHNIFKKCLLNKINIDINNDIDSILTYKIILIFDEELKEDFIIKCILNKIILLNCKNDKNNIRSSLFYKYSIDVNYELIPVFILFMLKNNEYINNTAYNNINFENKIFNEINYENTKNNNIVLENIKKKDNFGFIIVRHVNSEKTNNYWIESYKSIRKFYHNKIIIIDDNSNYEYIKFDDNLNIFNCEFIQSEYLARGEILGYYYFYKNRFFEKAVIIHDSVFINKYIDFDKYDNIRFIWHFTSPWFDESAEKKLIESINHTEELQQYYHKRELIHGCFGVQSVISYKFLSHIENKYDLFCLLQLIDSRNERMNLERIFALICIHEDCSLSKEPSIFGAIHEYIRFGYSYEDYLEDRKNNNIDNKEIIKVWTGR